MSEYWKSNPKKFCDYCKIWIQGNKATISIHENGRNHKENVRKRLQEIKKKSIEKKNEEKELGKSMAAIDRAAVAAMQTDLLNDPLLRKQYGLEVKSQSNSIPSTSSSFKNEDRAVCQNKALKRSISKDVPEYGSKILKAEKMKPRKDNLHTFDEKNDLQLPVKKGKTEKELLKFEPKNTIEVKDEINQINSESKWKPISNMDLSKESEIHGENVQSDITDIEIKKEAKEESDKVFELENSRKKEKIVKFKKRTKEVNLRQRSDE